MIGGQIIDMEGENRALSLTETETLQSLKTGALIRAGALMGCIIADADEKTKENARVYADNIGLAFQIKDDILDYDGTDTVGKPLGVDILEQKITMPLLGALRNVSEPEQSRVRAMVKDIVGQPELRDDVVNFVKANGGLEYSVLRLNEYVDAAVRALDVLPASAEKDFLVQLAHYTAKRDK